MPDLTADASCWGQLPSKKLFEKTESYFSLNFEVKKSFMKKTLTLSLSVNDVFGMTYKTSSSYPDGTTSVGNYRWDGRQAWVRLSYRFGNNKLMNRSPRQLKDPDESSRMGNGNSGGSGGAGGNNNP